MSGKRIVETRRALHLFLRCLPVGTLFNIISFGTRVVPLFDTPVEASNETVAIASDAVDTFEADLGGTDLVAALLRGLQQGGQIILLTDGYAVQPDRLLALVRDRPSTPPIHTVALSSDADRVVLRHLSRLTGGEARCVSVPHDLSAHIADMTARIVEHPPVVSPSVRWSVPVSSSLAPTPAIAHETVLFEELEELPATPPLRVECSAPGFRFVGEQADDAPSPIVTAAYVAQRIRRAEADGDDATAIQLALEHHILSKDTAFALDGAVFVPAVCSVPRRRSSLSCLSLMLLVACLPVVVVWWVVSWSVSALLFGAVVPLVCLAVRLVPGETARYDALLRAQRADGGFAGGVAATRAAVSALEERHASRRLEWRAVAKKARNFLLAHHQSKV